MKDKKSSKRKRRRHSGGKNGSDYIYDTAVHRAMSSYIGRGGIVNNFFRWIDTLSRPRLLISGPAGSGKTQFIAKSGLRHEFIYPDNHLSSANHDMPGWFFSDSAVCIDAPGALSPPERWSALCAALKKHRFCRRRAVDGLLFVIDICEFLSMDRPSASRLAAGLREQADVLASTTGHSVPVYFIFTKFDKIWSGHELLADKNIAISMPALGALFGDDGLKHQPAETFSRYYQKIYDDVSSVCLLKMIDADSVDKSRPLCRFLSEFLLAESKIFTLFADFFKHSGRTAPYIGGFFLTSAHNGGSVLGDIINGTKLKVKKAVTGTPGHSAKKNFLYLLMLMLCAAAAFGIAGSGLRDAVHVRTLKTELSSLLSGSPAIENQYMALEKLRRSYNYLEGTVKSPGRLIFGTGKARKTIKTAYITASEQLMISPVSKHLEVSITKLNQGRTGELTAEEHQSLYNDLKMYLLLAGGDKVDAVDITPITEMFEQSLKKNMGQRYQSINEKILKDNINTVIKLAADGRYQSSADKNIVQTARQKLAAAPRANVLYASVMDKLRTQRRDIPMTQIIGKNELLRYSSGISTLYTRDGWEQTVYAELTNASKDPFKADRVMGPAKTQTDEARLLSELVSLYSDDLCRRWLDFIRNIHVGLPADIPSLARDLERLSSRNSEIRRMLTTVCSLAIQQPEGIKPSQASPLSINAIKGQITNVSNKLRGDARNSTDDAIDPFVDAQKTFAALDAFLTGGGFDDYINTISDLAEKLKQCDDRGSFASTFVIRGDDPIKAARRGLTKAYSSMPVALSAALKRVLESPLDITAGILAKKISTEIEESWQAEIAARFNTRLSPRNPFNKNGADLSWNDFDEFFRPQSGILWKYQEKNLSGLMERTPKGWERAPARSMSIRISVDDDVIRAYNSAERITTYFFRSDGAPKRQHNIFYPFIPPGAASSPSQSGSEIMSSEAAMRGFAVPKKVLRD